MFFYSIDKWNCEKCKNSVSGLVTAYASEEGANEVTELVQGDAFCKSRLLNLGSDEKINECQIFLQNFIPAALKEVAKKVTEDSHYLCLDLFDEICSKDENKQVSNKEINYLPTYYYCVAKNWLKK